MVITDRFWAASISDLKLGFVEEDRDFICLLCGKSIEKGIIYQDGSRLVDARTYMERHITLTHTSVFDYLNALDKRLTGLSDHQGKLLQLFYQGKSDHEVQHEMAIGSASTIRNHRFALKEKERQAKLFLVMMDLLKEKSKNVLPERPPHESARMVDDRYSISEVEREKIIRRYFPQGTDGPMKTFSMKEKSRIVVLREICRKFEQERLYTEKELNQILMGVYPEDYVAIRRYLIEYGFMDRKADCSTYWLKGKGDTDEQGQ